MVELTSEEKWQIFNEVIFEMAKDDVFYFFADGSGDEEIPSCADISRIAKRYMEIMHNSEEWSFAVQEAINDWRDGRL